jgi:hypothetical protein
MLREFEERAKSGMNLVDNFKQSSEKLRSDTFRRSEGRQLGRTVESIYIDSSSANFGGPNINSGKTIGFGMMNSGRADQLRRGNQSLNAMDETLNISMGFN